jgi:copper chaperone
MQTINIAIDNLKCGGCAASIRKAIEKFPTVKNVEIDKETESITVEYEGELSRETVAQTLLSLGYPEKGTVDGLSAISSNLKSYVSCALGRLSSEKSAQ